MGLISLIPIIGQMVLLGWMLAALDNLRAGRQELPEAGFSYIGRGLRLFVVQLVYGLVIGVLASVVLLIGFGLLAAGSNEGSTAALATTFGGLIVAVVPDHDFVPIGQRRNAFGHAHGGAG